MNCPTCNNRMIQYAGFNGIASPDAPWECMGGCSAPSPVTNNKPGWTILYTDRWSYDQITQRPSKWPSDRFEFYGDEVRCLSTDVAVSIPPYVAIRFDGIFRSVSTRDFIEKIIPTLDVQAQSSQAAQAMLAKAQTPRTPGYLAASQPHSAAGSQPFSPDLYRDDPDACTLQLQAGGHLRTSGLTKLARELLDFW